RWERYHLGQQVLRRIQQHHDQRGLRRQQSIRAYGRMRRQLHLERDRRGNRGILWPERRGTGGGAVRVLDFHRRKNQPHGWWVHRQQAVAAAPGLRVRVLLVLAILLGWLPIGAAAMTLDSIMAAADGEDWSTAEHRAAMLDASEGQGDFYSAYVRARKLAGEGRCGEAVLIFDLLTLTRPYFAPAYEGAFLCLHAMGEVDAAIGRLDGLLAVLQEGPHRDLVFQIRQGLDAGDRPV